MKGQNSLMGGNLVLASVLALLSYVPFEMVAKTSLIVCAGMFIVDPFPPHSRLVSLVSTVVIALLSRAHRHWQIQQQQELEMEDALPPIENDNGTKKDD
jgi:hypothetical protein